MEEKNYKAIIEGILFTMGESVELEKIAGVIELDKKKTKTIIGTIPTAGLPSWSWTEPTRCVPSRRCTNI